MRRGSVLLVALITLLGLVRCSNDVREGSGGKEAASRRKGEDLTTNKRRYCELVNKLDSRGELTLSGAPGNSPPAQTPKALRDFLSANANELVELQFVAPVEIRSDVKTVIDGQRMAAVGDSSALERTQQVRERLRRYEEKECPN